MKTAPFSTLWTGLQNNVHNKPKRLKDPRSLGLPHAANWSLVPACQHVLCSICSTAVVQLPASLSTLLALLLMGSRTHH